MQDLLEILPGGKIVPIGKGVECFGVSLADIGRLVRLFPQLVDQLFSNKLDAAALIVMLPDAIVPLMAAGVGQLGNAKAEAGLARLSAYDQILLVSETIALTMPDGPGPFLERLKRAAAVIGLDLARLEALTPDSSPPESKSPAEARPTAGKRKAAA